MLQLRLRLFNGLAPRVGPGSPGAKGEGLAGSLGSSETSGFPEVLEGGSPPSAVYSTTLQCWLLVYCVRA